MKSIFVVLFAILSLSINAQDLCGTEDPETHTMPSQKDIQAEILRLQNADKMEPRIFMVTAHIIKSSTGNFGLSQTQFEEAMAKMNADYAPMNIRFELCGDVNEIRNTAYVTVDAEEAPYLVADFNVPNTINIYFIPNVLNGNGDNICGNANFTSTNKSSRRIFMQNNCVSNGSTLSHEMGHFFDLLHTHSTFYGPELVLRIGCENSGDGFCDTPADPRLSGLVNGACEYTGTEVDEFGIAYEPDPTLFMSYSLKECRTVFTPEQQAMVSLTASGANDYLFSECVELDFVLQDEGESIKVESFADAEGSFTIQSIAQLNSYDVSYEVAALDKWGGETVVDAGSVLVDAGDEVEVGFSLPFDDNFYRYEKIRIKLDEGNSWIETDEENNEIVLGIDHNYVREDAVLIFPQPAADELNIYLNRPGFSDVEIRVYNNSGQLVIEDSFRKTLSIFNKAYDVSNFLSGVYYIVIQHDTGDVETAKFVKI